MATPKNVFSAGDPILAEEINENFEELWAGYDAIVSPSGNEYSTIGGALTDGKKKIFVKNGNYTESQLSITQNNTLIVGESKEGVIITSSANGSGSKAVDINTDNISLKNLTIKGHLTDVTPDTESIIYISKNQAKGIIINNCNFFDTKGYFIYGNYAEIKAYNSLFDGTSKIAQLNSLISDLGMGSVILGCRIISQKTNDTHMPVIDYSYGLIQGCLIEGDVISVTFNDSGKMIGCEIKARRCYLNGGSFTGNYFDNDGKDPGTGWMLLPYNTRFIGNRVYCSYSARPLLYCTNWVIVCNNYFKGGSKIRLDAPYVIFCNNEWQNTGGGYTMTIEITSNANRCQVNHNIVIGGGDSTPVITDTGTGNNKLNNILYKE
jgi:hypothetical protein